MGIDPFEDLCSTLCYAVYKKSIFLDDKIMAMWGVCGNLFGTVGTIYLVTSTTVLDISPIRFARIYKREATVMSSLFPTLQNYVDASYEGAVRLLTISGFRLSGPFPVGVDEAPFYKFTLTKETY